MSNTELRIIIIDDNLGIPKDFIKAVPNKQPELDLRTDSLIDTIKSFELTELKLESASHGEDGVEKIKLARENNEPFALALVNIEKSSGEKSIEAIQRIWEIDPDIQVILCAADTENSWKEMIQQLGTNDNLLILNKPFENITIRQLILALIRKWLLANDIKNYYQSLNKTIAERTESLQQSLSLLRATIESSNNGILVLDLDNQVVDYNTQFVKMWNIPEAMLAKRDGNVLVNYMGEKLVHPNEFIVKFKNLSKNKEESTVQTMQFNSERIFESSSQPHQINGVTTGRIWSFQDITQQSYLQQKLEHQASHDSLTDLPNRILLKDRIQQAIASAERSKNNFAILFLDLDRFKLVNDSLNHEAGDELLRAVAERLSGVIRKEDTIARLGGDEFVIIIPKLANEESIVNVAQKILRSFESPFNLADHELTMSTSIGISLYPMDGTNVSNLVRKADLAMYQAKELGGNQFKFYTENLSQHSKQRLTQEFDLHQAITNNEFFLVYQPQFNIETNDILSVEALLRWQHPKKGLILPLDFIPVAEESGLIVPIGEWVIKEVCKQINRWHNNGLPYTRIAVNVTTQQLKQVSFAEFVENTLKLYQIAPKYLEIEITENVLITHAEVMQMINKLQKIGINIVLDNFGAGNSSLNDLKQLHIERLKINQKFVQNINKSRNDEVIIEAIMNMAKTLDFEVVAEGVETQNQLNFLKTQALTEAQGFFLSKPLSPESLEVLIKKDILNGGLVP